MFTVTIIDPIKKDKVDVKVYYHRPKVLRLVYPTKVEYTIDASYHPNKDIRLEHAKDFVRNHFAELGIEVVGS
jgi:hypothetical protein